RRDDRRRLLPRRRRQHRRARLRRHRPKRENRVRGQIHPHHRRILRLVRHPRRGFPAPRRTRHPAHRHHHAMSFFHPWLLWLAALPVLLFTLDLARRAPRSTAGGKILTADAGPGGLTLTPPDAARRARARWRLCLGLTRAAVALARPQWGRLEEPVFDQSREIIVAIDLSRSMLADDIKPSRLDRARLLTQSLLENTPGERVGLIVFAGTAFLQSPLSADHEIIRDFLPLLDPDFLPAGGTDYRALLATALDAFSDSAADRFLVILSDGEADRDDWRALAETARERDIRILTLGIGTPAGAMLPDGEGGFIKDQRGAVVLSKLDDTTLRELARITDG